MADVSQWSETAASNDVTSPAGANTGWTGSQVGPWARETMAAVRRFYGDPTWVNPLNDWTPSGTAKTVTRVDDNIFTIFATGMTDPSALFPVGRLLRVRSASDSTPCFVVSAVFSTNTITVDVACAARDSDSTAVLPGGSLSDDGVDFFSAQDDSATYQALGAPAFGGGGTTTVRNAKYPSATDLPDGIVWTDTTTSADPILQVSSAGSWSNLKIAKSDVLGTLGGITALSTSTRSGTGLGQDDIGTIEFQLSGTNVLVQWGWTEQVDSTPSSTAVITADYTYPTPFNSVPFVIAGRPSTDPELLNNVSVYVGDSPTDADPTTTIEGNWGTTATVLTSRIKGASSATVWNFPSFPFIAIGTPVPE